jgi:hypothetical protein
VVSDQRVRRGKLGVVGESETAGSDGRDKNEETDLSVVI